MSDLRRSIGLTFSVVVLAVWVCTSDANPHGESKPRPIQSEIELKRALRDSLMDRHAARAFSSELKVLWDGRRELLIDAANGENDYLAWAATCGLAAIGDRVAGRALASLLADSSLTFERRLNAAQALSWMNNGAESDLELLRRLSVEAARKGPVYKGAADLALMRAQRPDMRRPLISLGTTFLEFRFLLEDIARVYVLENPHAHVSSGVIYTQYPSYEQSHVFPPSEYRIICELLQDSTIEHPHGVSHDEYLVFELRDGREMAVTRSGNMFWAHNSDTGDWSRPWFTVKSERLAEYFDRARGYDQEPDLPEKSP